MWGINISPIIDDDFLQCLITMVIFVNIILTCLFSWDLESRLMWWVCAYHPNDLVKLIHVSSCYVMTMNYPGFNLTILDSAKSHMSSHSGICFKEVYLKHPFVVVKRKQLDSVRVSEVSVRCHEYLVHSKLSSHI